MASSKDAEALPIEKLAIEGGGEGTVDKPDIVIKPDKLQATQVLASRLLRVLSKPHRFSQLLRAWKRRARPWTAVDIMEPIWEILSSQGGGSHFLDSALMKECMGVSLTAFYYWMEPSHFRTQWNEKMKQLGMRKSEEIDLNKYEMKKRGPNTFVSDNHCSDNESNDEGCTNNDMDDMAQICLLKKIVAKSSSSSPAIFSLFISENLDRSFQYFEEVRIGASVKKSIKWEEGIQEDLSSFSEQNRRRNFELFHGSLYSDPYPLHETSESQKNLKNSWMKNNENGGGTGIDHDKKRKLMTYLNTIHQASKKSKQSNEQGTASNPVPVFSNLSQYSEPLSIITDVLLSSITEFENELRNANEKERNAAEENEETKEEDRSTSWIKNHPSFILGNLLLQRLMQNNQILQSSKSTSEFPFLSGYVIKCFESNPFLYKLLEIFLENSSLDFKTIFLPILDILLQDKITSLTQRRKLNPLSFTQQTTEKEKGEECRRLFLLASLSEFLPPPFSKCILIFDNLDLLDILNCFMLMRRFVKNCMDAMQIPKSNSGGTTPKVKDHSVSMFQYVLDKKKVSELNDAMDWEGFLFNIYRKHMDRIAIHFFHIFPIQPLE